MSKLIVTITFFDDTCIEEINFITEPGVFLKALVAQICDRLLAFEKSPNNNMLKMEEGRGRGDVGELQCTGEQRHQMCMKKKKSMRN